MFHQANVVPTDIELGDGTVVKDTTLLEYWYQVVLKKMALYLNLKGTDPFPARVRLARSDHGFFKDEEILLQFTLVERKSSSSSALSGWFIGRVLDRRNCM